MTLQSVHEARQEYGRSEPDRFRLRRLELLCDPHSLRILPADPVTPIGVTAASGRVGGRPIVCYAQDGSVAGGSIGAAEADLIVRALRLARRRRVPVVAFVETAGARLQEGVDALGGFSRIFFENVALSSKAPQISVISGTSAGGGCYSPALTDFVIMTQTSAMFLTGPKVVQEVTGERIAAENLGGPTIHQRNGVCHFLARDDGDGAAVARRLLEYLSPPSLDALPEFRHCAPEDDPGRHVPKTSRSVYDVRRVACSLVDGGQLLEVAPKWSRNLFTAFACVAGRSVGIIANQPHHLGGVLDVGASEKGATFVATCDRFGIPLVVLVDTPGFMPGARHEASGIIRHGAQLVRAFASATVPSVTVILRKAYGGGYIAMNSKDLGAGVALAWEGAEIGVMGAHAAVRIVHRRSLAAARGSDRLLARLAADYASQHISAARALASGVIDEVIQPRDTRAWLTRALADS